MESLTAENARSFSRYSVAHAELLAAAAQERGCNCAPYRDWFTYRRWLAQGYQVQRGEHGVHLTTWITATTEDDNGQITTRTMPKGTTVFCRCQVKPIG